MTVEAGAVVDRSGTVASGGAAQTAAAAQSARTYLLIQNLSTDTLWVNLGGTAAAGAGSFPLDPDGGAWVSRRFVPANLVSVFGATTGQAYSIKESWTSQDVRLFPQQLSDQGVAEGVNTGLTVIDRYLVSNDGRVFLHLQKTGADPCTVTVASTATVGSLDVADATAVVPALTGDLLMGPFDPAVFNSPAGDLTIQFDNTAGLSMAVLRM